MGYQRSPKSFRLFPWNRSRSRLEPGRYRRACFESLESRQLLSVTLPVISDQAVSAGAPLNLALNGTSSASNALSYTVSVSNSQLTSSSVSNPQLTAAVPTGNPSLRIVVNDSADGITDGTMTLQLFQDLAPETVSKITSLVSQGFYNGLTFHRVISDFMIQGGDPEGDGTGGPGYEIDDEIDASLQFTSAGVLAMANSGADTSGSQFFITTVPTRWLDFRYTIFGFLTEGSDVLQAIDAVSTDSNDKPLNTVTMSSVTTFTDTENGVLRLSAPNGTTGTADVTVTVTDTVTQESTSQTFHVTVQADTNSDPAFLDDIDPIQTTANTPVTFTIPAINPDGLTLTYTGSVSPANSNLTLTVDSATGQATLTPSNGVTGVFSVQVGVNASGTTTSVSADTQMVPVYISPASPTGVLLLPASDTGSSDSDNVTSLDNTAGKTLQFQVDGVVSGATVELLADGTSIGSATASGTSVTITTNGTVPLGDGDVAITARQTLNDQAVSVGNLSTTTDLAGPASSALTVTIAADNTAPVLTAAAPALGSTSKNAPATIETWTFINNDDGSTTITDDDEDAVLGGIAVVGTTGSGTWSYSTDGSTFTAIGSVGSTSALLLGPDAQLRYTPNGASAETATITYRAWDATSGAEGGRADLSASGAVGGSTAFSTATDTASLTVSDVTDAIVLTPANPSLGGTTGAVQTISLSTFINAGSGSTVITAPSTGTILGGIALIDASGDGTWEYSTDSGQTFDELPAVGEDAALLLKSTARLRYTPAEDVGEIATITYRAWDSATGAEGDQVDLTETDAVGGSTGFSTSTDTASLTVNTAPVLTAASPSMGTTDSSTAKTIDLAELINNGTGTTTISDADADATVGGIALVGVSGSGTWAYSLDGSTFTSVGTVSSTSALLLPDTATLRFTPSGSGAQTATITYRAWDATSGADEGRADTTTTGGYTAFSTAADTASLSVTGGSNTAPVLTAASPSLGTTALTAVKTVAISTIINNGSGTTTVTDADASAVVGGMALTGVTGNGTWSYSLDGSTFTSVGTVSTTSALLLPKTASLRYTPSGSSNETATITYRAWDTTSGAGGSTADTTTNGAATAFSTATDTASLTVSGNNTAPVLTGVSPSLGSAEGTTAKTIPISTFINNGSGTTTVTDADTSAVVGGIALTGVTGSGTWAYSTDGSTFTSVGTVSTTSALLLPKTASLRYTPSGASGETPTITYRAWDTTSGASGGTADTTTNGAATAFSTATDTASLSAGTASLSGFVYIDNNNDGLRTRSDGNVHLGIPGVPVRLLQLSGSDWIDVAGKSPVLTGSDGSYSFSGLVAGTYRIQEVELSQFLDGTDTTGSAGGTASRTDGIDVFEVALASGATGAEYNFGERGLRPDMISLRWFLTSASSSSASLSQLNAKPVVTLSNSASTFTTTYTAGDSAVAIADSDATVADSDSPMLGRLVATITNRQDGDSEILEADTSDTSLTSVYAGGVLTISGAADPSVYEQVLATIEYSNTSSAAHGGSRTITIVVNDGVNDSETATATVEVDASLSGYTIAANDSLVSDSEASSTGFTFSGAEVGATYDYTVTSSGGGTAVTGSGTVNSATQQVTGINVSGLSDGTLTFSVTLTDTDGNTGTAVTATATLDQTVPSGYTITANDSAINAADGSTTGFTFAGAEIGATYAYTVTSSGGGTAVTGSGTITSATQQVTGIGISSLSDGTLTFSVTLTDPAGNAGTAATAAAVLDKTLPTGYTITANDSAINASEATSTSFTFAGAEVGATYAYTVTSSGGGTAVTGSGTISSATQQVTGINVSGLSDGTLTYSVTLTDAAGNAGAAVTATATLNNGPTGYTITADDSAINASEATSTSLTFAGAEVGATYAYTVTSSGGGTAVTGSGTITSATQQVTGINVSGLSDGTLTYSVTLTDTGGSAGAAATATAILDRTAPSGYSIVAGDSLINVTEAISTSFTFSGAEVGATYSYSITSSGGGTAVTGSGMITSATQQITGINVSGLSDGTLTFSVTLTDAAGNAGSAVTHTTTLDKTAPSGYTITLDDTAITASEASNVGFTINGAEIGATYQYTIVGGGSTSITGSGTVTSATQHVTGIDISSLSDSTVIFGVTLTDPAGNTGGATTATATLDNVPMGYTITANDSLINASEATAVSFTFAGAEVGATYSYTVSSSGGGTAVTGSGTITSAAQQVTGINVSTLSDGTLTYSVTLTDTGGNTGAATTATATLDTTAPSGYTVSANDSTISATEAASTSFTFAGAEVGASYQYSVTSSGGGTAVTGSGTITSATQQVTGIDVSSLPDGTLTYSVTLTDPAGNAGAAVTATTTLNNVPMGYTIAADDSLINAADAASISFTFAGAEVGATYQYTVTSSGGGTAVTGSGTITSATQQVTGINVSSLPEGTLTFSVSLTDTSGNTGSAVAATATLDKTAPSGYTITAGDNLMSAAEAAATSFTFAGAEVGATYQYSVTSGGSGTAVTGNGTITSATQQVTGINVSSLPDGTLTYSVTLTDPAGNAGTTATATSTLDKTAPSGYTIAADDSQISVTEAASTSFTFAGAEVGAAYHYSVTSSGGGTAVLGSGTVSSATQQVTGINVSSLPDGTLTYSVLLTDTAGNTGIAATTPAMLDNAPLGYTIAAGDSLINATESASTSFTFAGAEVGATYQYSVTSSGGGAAVTGSGTVSSATQQVAGINVSSLSDGTLTYSATLTDTTGNTGGAVTVTATLDKTAPAAYTITLDNAQIGATEATSTGFTFTGAEVGATYHYSVTSSGGGTAVTGTGTISSATQHVTTIDVSSLSDGTLTFSVTLTDTAGNVGTAATATATLDRTTVAAAVDAALSQMDDFLP